MSDLYNYGLPGYGASGVGPIGPNGMSNSAAPLNPVQAQQLAAIGMQYANYQPADPVSSPQAGTAPPSRTPPLPSQLPYADPSMASAPSFKTAMAQGESGGDPNAQNPNSSASGTFQFTDSTFAKFLSSQANQKPGGGRWTMADKTDPQAQSQAMDWLTDQNKQELGAALGRDPTDSELAAAHLMGAPGALAAIQNPNGNAYGSYSGVVGDKTASAAFAGNPRLMGKDLTNAQMLSNIGQYYLGGQLQPSPSVAQDQMRQDGVASPSPPPPPQSNTTMLPGDRLAQLGQLPGYGPSAYGSIRPQPVQAPQITDSDKLLALAAGYMRGDTASDRMANGIENYLGMKQLDRDNQFKAAQMNNELARLGITDRQSQAQILALAGRLDQGQQRIDQAGAHQQAQEAQGAQRIGIAQGNLANNTARTSAQVNGTMAQNQATGREAGKDNADAVDDALKQSNAALDTLQQVGNVRQLIQQNGGVMGPGVIQGIKRVLVNNGFDVGDVNTPSLSLTQQQLAQFNTAGIRQGAHGLFNRLTNGETNLLQTTLPNINSDPQAAQTALGLIEQGAKRQAAFGQMYNGLSPADQATYRNNGASNVSRFKQSQFATLGIDGNPNTPTPATIAPSGNGTWKVPPPGTVMTTKSGVKIEILPN